MKNAYFYINTLLFSPEKKGGYVFLWYVCTRKEDNGKSQYVTWELLSDSMVTKIFFTIFVGHSNYPYFE